MTGLSRGQLAEALGKLGQGHEPRPGQVKFGVFRLLADVHQGITVERTAF